MGYIISLLFEHYGLGELKGQYITFKRRNKTKKRYNKFQEGVLTLCKTRINAKGRNNTFQKAS